MIDLPPFSDVEVVRLSREGGLAYIPGLARLRVFELDRCSDTLRGQIRRAVTEALLAAQAPQPSAGGDRRFFRIELDLRTTPRTTARCFEVSEADAPPTLVALWQAGPNTE